MISGLHGAALRLPLDENLWPSIKYINERADINKLREERGQRLTFG